MKLIHINASYKPAWIYGGPTMSVAKLCEALKESGQNIEVLTTLANGKEELNICPNKSTHIDGVKVTYFKRITKDHSHLSPSLLLALRSRLKTNEKIIIHIHAWWNLVSIFSCMIAKWYNIPVLLSTRGMLTYYTQNNRNTFLKSIFHKLVGRSLLEYCSIHTTSEKERQDVLQIIKPKSIHTIPNLVDLPARTQNSSNRNQFENRLNLIFLSRIEEKKGLDLLFKALANIDFEWTLTIAGKGEIHYLKKIKTLAKTLKIDQKINWIGQIANEDKFNLIREHDLLVLTSHNENFANVIIESLSVGTPVLISNQVGLYDYVMKNNFGWVTELKPEKISLKLIEAYKNIALRKQINENAPTIIEHDYNSGNLVQQYNTLYNQIRNGQL